MQNGFLRGERHLVDFLSFRFWGGIVLLWALKGLDGLAVLRCIGFSSRSFRI